MADKTKLVADLLEDIADMLDHKIYGSREAIAMAFELGKGMGGTEGAQSIVDAVKPQLKVST